MSEITNNANELSMLSKHEIEKLEKKAAEPFYADKGHHVGMKNMIAIKPHHFVDIVTAFGEGCSEFKPHRYGHAVHSVANAILANRDTNLRMELGADDICRPCRHNINGLCDDTIDTSFRPAAPKSKREWNLIIDRRWCERLGIQQDDRLTARELCSLIRDRAGDITDIYREIPIDRTAERQTKLQKGVAKFLEQERAEPAG